MKHPLIASLCLAAALAAAAKGPACQGLESPPGGEVRTYEVRIDNKPSGIYQLQLVSKGVDTDVDSKCDIDYRFFVLHYRYSYRGHEKWHNGRLLELSSNCTDDGKKCTVSFVKNAQGETLAVNGKTKSVDGDVLASSYWHSPKDDDFAAQFLEVDSGRIFTGNFKFVGIENVLVADRQESCKHFRVSGGDQSDLWYDQKNRLVKQSTDGDGHPTLITLKSVEYR